MKRSAPDACLELEVFDTDAGGRTQTGMPSVQAAAVEEAKLAAYEQGYTAGWDDAAAAQSDDQTRIRADLARNLQSCPLPIRRRGRMS